MTWNQILFAVAFLLGLAAIVVGTFAAQRRFERLIDEEDPR